MVISTMIEELIVGWFVRVLAYEHNWTSLERPSSQLMLSRLSVQKRWPHRILPKKRRPQQMEMARVLKSRPTVRRERLLGSFATNRVHATRTSVRKSNYSFILQSQSSCWIAFWRRAIRNTSIVPISLSVQSLKERSWERVTLAHQRQETKWQFGKCLFNCQNGLFHGNGLNRCHVVIDVASSFHWDAN